MSSSQAFRARRISNLKKTDPRAKGLVCCPSDPDAVLSYICLNGRCLPESTTAAHNAPRANSTLTSSLRFCAGFLTTGSDVMRGNFGLLDQVEALRWVRAHIAAFRGDAARVTIFGHSAGGASVGLLLTVPSAAGQSVHRAGLLPLCNPCSLHSTNRPKDQVQVCMCAAWCLAVFEPALKSL